MCCVAHIHTHTHVLFSILTQSPLLAVVLEPQIHLISLHFPLGSLYQVMQDLDSGEHDGHCGWPSLLLCCETAVLVHCLVIVSTAIHLYINYMCEIDCCNCYNFTHDQIQHFVYFVYT